MNLLSVSKPCILCTSERSSPSILPILVFYKTQEKIEKSLSLLILMESLRAIVDFCGHSFGAGDRHMGSTELDESRVAKLPFSTVNLGYYLHTKSIYWH